MKPRSQREMQLTQQKLDRLERRLHEMDATQETTAAAKLSRQSLVKLANQLREELARYRAASDTH